MRLLKEILYKAGIEEVIGNTNASANGICSNSKEVRAGELYVALRGMQVDGHTYIQQAIENGATSILCESLPDVIQSGINYIRVKNTQLGLAEVCANFYNHPSSKLKLVGITGTNGKTTTATLLYQLFTELGFKTGLLSTVENRIVHEAIPATHTTPDPIQLNKLLSLMVLEGCEYCFMEVSSHAVVQHRINALQFAGGIFTNITHDHLDYHQTFEAYIRAKKGFFDLLPETAFALVNADDKNSSIMLQNTRASKYTYSLHAMSNYRARIIENNFHGLLLMMDQVEVACKLIGSFNAYNLTGIYATAMLLGLDKQRVLTVLSNLSPVSGRFECITSGTNITGIVDYAHTPDALKNVLSTIADIRTRNEKVITIVGCGGNRDVTKRPLMAQIACEYSDKIILTSDNPRNEEPQLIIEQMRAGVQPQHVAKVMAITDRKEAIHVACNLARQGDIILLAGKGHETYQEIKGVKYPFDDKKILMESFKTLNT
jgi:UDP-N-acetylmuramoyl-L-alanyl-D-glutamate--2,6-diaminopimelate ligase